MTIDSLICDYGGVVADHYCEPYFGQLARALGVSRDSLRELLTENSPHGRLYRVDQMSKSEFWAEVQRLASKADVDADWLQEMWAMTYIPNAAVLSLLRHLKEDLGVQTGIIMNEDRWRYEFITNRYEMDRYASLMVPSFEVGAIKPEAAIYDALLARCRRSKKPATVLYIDDRQTHVDAGVAFGMKGHVYQNAGELACFLASIDFVRFEP